jgi:hypothetical protein
MTSIDDILTGFSEVHGTESEKLAWLRGGLRSRQVGQDYTDKAACEAADYCCPTNGKSIGWINQCFRKDPSCCVNTTATIFPRLSNGPTGRGPTARLAFFVAPNIEEFPYGEGLAIELNPKQREPDIPNYT